jgi:hypothetical protein
MRAESTAFEWPVTAAAPSVQISAAPAFLVRRHLEVVGGTEGRAEA